MICFNCPERYSEAWDRGERCADHRPPLLKKRMRQNRWVKAQRKQVKLEASVEQAAVLALEALGCWCPKFGKQGWPDRLVLLGHGRHVWLEFKRQKFGSLTPAQRRRIPDMRKRGEPVFVVRTVEEALKAVFGEERHAA